MKRGAQKAKEDYIDDHPEIGDIDIDFDPSVEFTARKLYVIVIRVII